MSACDGLRLELRNMLQYGDLPFRDFMEMALYHPEYGYYSQRRSPVGKQGDFITGPLLSPVFSFALGRLVTEFLGRQGDEASSVVDIGCGDGSLINTLSQWSAATFYGVDRSLDRIAREDGVTYLRTLDEVPRDGTHLVLSNELFDAFPFSRFVQRDEHLHELWVTERDGELDWKEYEASAPSEDYFAARSIQLADGQFADISAEWEAYYSDVCRLTERGLIVTFDYGYPEEKLFRFRRFGTAAAYSNHRVTRDLLANPGAQDLTAHINFTDLIRAGERAGFTTLFFDRQAKFLLALGATEHPLLQPLEGEMTSLEAGIDLIEQREEAKRLILPDDIGNDIRVLVQGRGIPFDGWSFQRPLY